MNDIRVPIHSVAQATQSTKASALLRDLSHSLGQNGGLHRAPIRSRSTTMHVRIPSYKHPKVRCGRASALPVAQVGLPMGARGLRPGWMQRPTRRCGGVTCAITDLRLVVVRCGEGRSGEVRTNVGAGLRVMVVHQGWRSRSRVARSRPARTRNHGHPTSADNPTLRLDLQERGVGSHSRRTQP